MKDLHIIPLKGFKIELHNLNMTPDPPWTAYFVAKQSLLQMIEEVKGLAVIRGYRGMTKGDCKALAEAVAAFSQLAAFDDIAEAEINPLIVRKEGDGVVAVDGLIVRQ